MKSKFLFAALLLVSLSSHAAIETFEEYIKIVKNDKLNIHAHWSAMMKSTELAEGSDVDEIRSFVNSKEWYLRNAALVALNKVDPQRAEIDRRPRRS